MPNSFKATYSVIGIKNISVLILFDLGWSWLILSDPCWSVLVDLGWCFGDPSWFGWACLMLGHIDHHYYYWSLSKWSSRSYLLAWSPFIHFILLIKWRIWSSSPLRFQNVALASMRYLYLIAHQKGHGIPSRDPNKHKHFKKFCIFKIILTSVEMTGNTWKWLYIIGSGCMRAITGSNWLKMTGLDDCIGLDRIGLDEWIGNWWKWIEIARHCWAGKCYIQYHSHV